MKKYLAIAFIGALASFSAQGAELILTPSNSASTEKAALVNTARNSVALDFVSDGDVVGFQANIHLPKGTDASQVNVKSCVAEVSAKYFSSCNVAKNQIVVQVVNDDGTPLPAGLFSVGKISLNGVSAHQFGKIDLVAADARADAITSTVRVVK